MNNKFYIDDKDKTPMKLTDAKGNFNILKKIIPAILVFAIAIGLANFIGFLKIDALIHPGEINSDMAVAAEYKINNGVLTSLPRVVEKSIFENLLATIPEGKMPSGTSGKFIKNRMNAYYTLKNLDEGTFYIFGDPGAGKRTISEILGYWNEYIDWNDAEYFNMLIDYQMLDSRYLHAAPERSSFEAINYNNTD